MSAPLRRVAPPRPVIRAEAKSRELREALCTSLGYRPGDVISVRVTRKEAVVTYLEHGSLRGPVVHPLVEDE